MKNSFKSSLNCNIFPENLLNSHRPEQFIRKLLQVLVKLKHLSEELHYYHRELEQFI